MAKRSSPADPPQPGRALQIERDAKGAPEHRGFPRARLAVPVALSVLKGDEVRFSANVVTEDLSVFGAFLASSFFLPVGTRLRVRFKLEAEKHPIEAEAEIVRQESPGRGGGRSGFAVRFLDFLGQGEVPLTRLFLEEGLREFAREYLATPRARSFSNELDRVVDALAAWELRKVISGQDVWADAAGKEERRR